MNKNQKNIIFTVIPIILVVIAALFLTKLTNKDNISNNNNKNNNQVITKSSVPKEVISELANIDVNNLPINKPYKTLNNNTPYFTKEDLTTKSFESYSNLDKLGRVGVANASISVDLMPTEKRQPIFNVRPSGWRANRETHVYDRTHLIGYLLTGENDNDKNLMTGTRFMNVETMNPFELKVFDYIKKTKNHVRYRITPVFFENDLVAKGVIMEAQSVEDNGKAIKFNIFCYNFQENVKIDYKTGKYQITK